MNTIGFGSIELLSAFIEFATTCKFFNIMLNEDGTDSSRCPCLQTSKGGKELKSLHDMFVGFVGAWTIKERQQKAASYENRRF